MKLLRSWLQDWIDLTDIDDTDLSTALESLGFEIEDYKLINPDYKNIIVGCPTWNVGELQEDWDLLFNDYQKLRFDDITGAFFGVGDQMGYSCNYLDAVGLLARPFMENGGKLVGRWPTEGYDFEESVALEGNEFLGLALDYDNQDMESEERIKKWTALIQSEFK